MTNQPRAMKAKKRALALKERRLRQAGRILDKGHADIVQMAHAREAELNEAMSRGMHEGYHQGFGVAKVIVDNARTIKAARKELEVEADAHD